MDSATQGLRNAGMRGYIYSDTQDIYTITPRSFSSTQRPSSTHIGLAPPLKPDLIITLSRWNMTCSPDAAQAPPGAVLEFRLPRQDVDFLISTSETPCAKHDASIEVQSAKHSSEWIAEYVVEDSRPRVIYAVAHTKNGSCHSWPAFRLNGGNQSSPQTVITTRATNSRSPATRPSPTTQASPPAQASLTTQPNPTLQTSAGTRKTSPPFLRLWRFLVLVFSLFVGCNARPHGVSVESCVMVAGQDQDCVTIEEELDFPDSRHLHVVTIGANGSSIFQPNHLHASLGDIVRFQFLGGNHTMSQSTVRDRCSLAGTIDANVTMDLLVGTTAP